MNGMNMPYRTYSDDQRPCTDVGKLTTLRKTDRPQHYASFKTLKLLSGPDDLWISKSKEDEGMFNPVTDALADFDEMMFWDVELTAEQVWRLFSSYNSTGFTEFPP